MRNCKAEATILVQPEELDGKKEESFLICPTHHTYTDENGATPFLTGCKFERLNQN